MHAREHGNSNNTTFWAFTAKKAYHIPDCPENRRLKKNGMNESEAYQYFVLRAQKIALSHGYEIVNW